MEVKFCWPTVEGVENYDYNAGYEWYTYGDNKELFKNAN